MQLWPFNRKQDQNTDIPKEVQDYYQAEKRERVGVAGLLAVGTLLVTILLAMGLFFGGRWAYRAVFNDDDKQDTVQQTDDEDRAAEETSPPTDEPDQVADRPATTPTAPVTPSVPRPTQPTGDLPTTGPADNARLVFSTVILASTGYYLFGNKKNRAIK